MEDDIESIRINSTAGAFLEGIPSGTSEILLVIREPWESDDGAGVREATVRIDRAKAIAFAEWLRSMAWNLSGGCAVLSNPVSSISRPTRTRFYVFSDRPGNRHRVRVDLVDGVLVARFRHTPDSDEAVPVAEMDGDWEEGFPWQVQG